MKHIRTICRYLQLGIILFILAACNDEYIPGDTMSEETSEDVILVELFTSAQEFQKPVTRAAMANENSIQGSMPWVLVFRGDNDNAMFFEVSRAIDSNGSLAVPLTKTTSKSRIFIIANPPDQFFDGTVDNLSMDKTLLTSKLSGKTYTQALAILNTQKLSSPQVSVPYAGGYLPMSASVNLNSINEQTTIGSVANKVLLTRIVAKVTVENLSQNFKLEGFTVTGAKQYGGFLQSSLLISTGNKVDYSALSPADPVSGISSGNDPIYIYESAAGETSVIVKGRYNNVIGYYRLVFKDSNNTLMSIGRNKWHQFKIKNVNISGYKTFEEAIVASPSNIMAELQVIDQSSMEINDNGQYYIGLTNSEFIVYSNVAQNNLTAVTVTHDAPLGIFTKTEVLSASPVSSMSISVGNIIANGSVGGTDIKINLKQEFNNGSIKLTIGNLDRVVQVKRIPMVMWQESNIVFNPGYVSAKIDSQGNGGSSWLTLSTNGVNYTDNEVTRLDNPGTVHLKVGNNSGNLLRSGGVVYLARKDSQGHSKLYITQSAYMQR